MRAQLCAALVARAVRANMVFLTGDLGFMALEPLRERLGARFINCGVSEQNMVSVAAGLAREGLEPWVYTIAPFCYARAFEQIRNDICLHGLPVHLLGNGGGYGYGVMGPTHHALEDYGVLLALSGMTAYVPAFDEDVAAVVERAGVAAGPCYIRLGRGELPAGAVLPEYAPWRCLASGDGPVVVVTGPLAGPAMGALAELQTVHPELWVVSELPLTAISPPPGFAARIAASGRLCVIEEHVEQGGLGQMLAIWAQNTGIAVRAFRHQHARGYPSGLYGSQAFHRRESMLDADSIRGAVLALAT
jgi:transketolase